MARRIILKDNELSLSPNPPSGYKFIGYSGATFSEKQSDGDIIPLVGYGSGSSGTSGANGSSGTSGANGSSGTSGANGSSGTSGTGSGYSYLIYTALITQSGGGNPTVTVLENTIGNIVWERSGTGSYTGNLSNAFTLGKTFTLIGTSTYLFNTGLVFARNSVNSVYILTQTNNIQVDNILYDTSIEIRVYP